MTEFNSAADKTAADDRSLEPSQTNAAPSRDEQPVGSRAKRSRSPSRSPQRKRSRSESSQKEPGERSESDDSSSEQPDVPRPLKSTAESADDGWEAIWEDSVGTYYFYNRFTQASSWTNPRVPDASAPTTAGAPGIDPSTQTSYSTLQQAQPQPSTAPARETYNPAIHGSYDPTAAYAQEPEPSADHPSFPLSSTEDPSSSTTTAAYAATGTFNRFTGRWQAPDVGPELHNDESKSRRQMHAFFDVDAAANQHEGKSLRAERSGKKLSKQELRAFKEKRRDRKEEKRRAWLRD